MNARLAAAAALLLPALAAAAPIPLLPPGVETGLRTIGFLGDVDVIEVAVPDGEPMYAAIRRNGDLAAFFRAGEEQCLDKMMGVVNCASASDEHIEWADPAELPPAIGDWPYANSAASARHASGAASTLSGSGSLFSGAGSPFRGGAPGGGFFIGGLSRPDTVAEVPATEHITPVSLPTALPLLGVAILTLLAVRRRASAGQSPPGA